jgi:hypothetical protein
MNCVKEVAELSKSTIFGGGDYTFRADCTTVPCHVFAVNYLVIDYV